jgi:hypothetical protein
VIDWPEPKYVLVSEMLGHIPAPGPGLLRNVNPAEARAGVYWEFDANFRCRDLSLLVTSNEPGGVASHVARRVLATERYGK